VLIKGTCVDHDHNISGKPKIRGIACYGCNSIRFPLWDRGPDVIARATRLSQFYLQVTETPSQCEVYEIPIPDDDDAEVDNNNIDDDDDDDDDDDSVLVVA